MRNIDLKIAILRSGEKNYELAQKLHWHPTKISSILSGIYKPSSIEKEDLAQVLGTSVEEIFPPRKRVAHA